MTEKLFLEANIFFRECTRQRTVANLNTLRWNFCRQNPQKQQIAAVFLHCYVFPDDLVRGSLPFVTEIYLSSLAQDASTSIASVDQSFILIQNCSSEWLSFFPRSTKRCT